MIKEMREDIQFVMDVTSTHKTMTNKAKSMALQNLKNGMVEKQEEQAKEIEEPREYVIMANAAEAGK